VHEVEQRFPSGIIIWKRVLEEIEKVISKKKKIKILEVFIGDQI